ncbi:EAL domain-containing protein [Hydrogenovibrio kuenenii]|uniref:EAL domain-containing protein n=1 Tax=Hydrogenovibrio kuenenii TaxID=63658 RepID=UPI0004652A7B|nr:EAL domain-containing protein [Hydrogenovibrio kuenenii]
MWRKLSIKLQLMILISVVTFTVVISSLTVAFWLDKKQRQNLAIELSNQINTALKHDLLEGMLSNSVDAYSDLNFTLSGFQQIDRVVLLDNDNRSIYTYRHGSHHYHDLIAKSTETPQFSGVDLYVTHPLEEGGHRFGSVVYVIDMEDFSTQIEKHLIFLILALPLELIFALILAWWISRSYNKPFSLLADSMQKNDVIRNRFYTVETTSQNEIGKLFDGYNQMIQKVESTTEQMRYQSEHDSLTGLFNRYYIEHQIQTCLQDDSVNNHTIIALDIDQFRLINDSAGHQAGDELLKMVSQHCLQHLTKDAMMGRVESDIFYLLLPQYSEKQAMLLANGMLDIMADFRFTWQGEAHSVSASVGMVVFKPNEYTLEELIKALESATHTAKSLGRNKLHIFQPNDKTTALYNQELQIANMVKEALANGPDSDSTRFELYAQAIVPLQTPEVSRNKIGYEILIRLRNSEGQIVPPDQFLPTAERYQLMSEIDSYVLWHFIETVSAHPEHLDKLHLAHVNLAGSSLNHPDFQAKLKQAVTTFHFPWQKLELEITETSAIGSFSQAAEFIQYCKNLGIGLALDDFGTGMSSFEYLKSLPFDVVKIDGSFIKDMHTDPSDKAVIRYIQEISALRNQETVAEYVETEQDLQALTEIGITYGQGYYLGKPKPLSEWL